jgi:ferric-dicitrate binding protein FerR (iron transport regulator)
MTDQSAKNKENRSQINPRMKEDDLMKPNLEDAPGELQALSETHARSLDYLLGGLPPAEAARFERELAAHPGRRDELAAGRKVLGILRDVLRDPPGADRVNSLTLPRLRESSESFNPAKIGVPQTGAFWGPRAVWAIGLAAVFVVGLAAVIWIGGAVKDQRREVSAASQPASENLRIKIQGQSAWINAADSRIEIPEGTHALFTLGAPVRGLLAGEAALEGLSPDRLRLKSGAAWFWVEEPGAGLTVETPAGDVIVAGTSFGVTASASEITVEVSRGDVSVELPSGASAIQVGGGEMLASAGGAVTARPEGNQLPPWVSAILSEEREAWTGGVLPSLSGEGKRRDQE